MEGSGTQMTPLGAIVRGLVAGAVGSAAMDLVWYWQYQRSGGKSHPLDWEFSAGLRAWDSAPAPAQLGKHLYEGFFQRELPADRAALTNTIMHWGYGMSWGGLYGVVAGSLRCPRVIFGLPLGAGIWASSYILLPLAKVYKPIWKYDAQTLLKDFTAHLAYGFGTAGAFALLARLVRE
jgi:hypothetical protein